MMEAYTTSTLEAEAEGSLVQGQPVVSIETLCHLKKKNSNCWVLGMSRTGGTQRINGPL
jgi:hypothetical protein